MIIFHADDYGFLPTVSSNILKCIDSGAINSISIMPNSSYFDQCMNMLKDSPEVLKTVHLNIVDGSALSKAEQVEGLVDERGNFAPSFGKYLIYSLIPGMRKKYFEYFYQEIDRQVERALPYINKDGVRLDSHGHYHMIPVYFDAMMQVVSDKNLKLEYVRMPKEVISLYLKAGVKVLPINMVKVAILNLLYIRNSFKHKKALKNTKKALFMGVMLSGHMNYEDVSKVLPYAKKYAEDKGLDIELLFHPGGTCDKDEISQVTFELDKEFFQSKNRQVEADACCRIAKEMQE